MTLLPEEDGVIQQVFPGLWLDVVAMLDGNMPQVLSVLQSGINSAEQPLSSDWQMLNLARLSECSDGKRRE